MAAIRIEDKLYQNRYLVDAGRPHIKLRPHETPSPRMLALTTACPAGCYSLDDQGRLEIVPDGCLECGTCRVLCGESGEVDWNYPRGGFGVLFKFG